jgi:hypothetical protein
MRRIVHVVPLGWEYDRVVRPISLMHAHRVHLLCRPDSDPVRSHYLDMVKVFLERKGIDVKHHDVDANSDLSGLLREMSDIVQTEQRANNTLMINIAGAGKVAAAASMLVAMAHLSSHTGLLYYPVADDYSRTEKDRMEHGLSIGMSGDPVEIPFFRLPIPQGDSRVVLWALSNAPGGTLSYTACIDLLSKRGSKGYEIPKKPKDGKRGVPRNLSNVTLNRRVVKKLLEWKFVEVESAGSERMLKLTDQGRHMAMLCTFGESAMQLEV